MNWKCRQVDEANSSSLKALLEYWECAFLYNPWNNIPRRWSLKILCGPLKVLEKWLHFFGWTLVFLKYAWNRRVCAQTLFSYSFRDGGWSAGEKKKGFPAPTPLGLWSINLPPILFSYAHLTISKEKLAGLWIGYWNYHFIGSEQWQGMRSNEL